MSKKQPIVMYFSCNLARELIEGVGFAQEEPIEIFIDNKSAITLAKKPLFNDRSKHIDTRYHFIREYVKRRKYKQSMSNHMIKLLTSFTKPLKQEDFFRLRTLLSVIKQV